MSAVRDIRSLNAEELAEARVRAKALEAEKLERVRSDAYNEGEADGFARGRVNLETALEAVKQAHAVAREGELHQVKLAGAKEAHAAHAHGFYKGGAFGLVVGAAAALAASLMAARDLQSSAFEAATAATAQGVAVGAVRASAGDE